MITEVPIQTPDSVIERKLGTAPDTGFYDPPTVYIDSSRETIWIGCHFGSSIVPSRTASDIGSVGSKLQTRTTTSAAAVGIVADLDSADDSLAQLHMIKARLGINVEQISKLLGCSRQAYYSWLKGGKIAAVNKRRIAELSATVRKIDRGHVEKNNELLYISVNGRLLFDLLEDGHFEEVKSITSSGTNHTKPSSTQKNTTESPASLWYDKLVTADDSFTDSSPRYVEQGTKKRLRLKKA